MRKATVTVSQVFDGYLTLEMLNSVEEKLSIPNGTRFSVESSETDDSFYYTVEWEWQV